MLELNTCKWEKNFFPLCLCVCAFMKTSPLWYLHWIFFRLLYINWRHVQNLMISLTISLFCCMWEMCWMTPFCRKCSEGRNSFIWVKFAFVVRKKRDEYIYIHSFFFYHFISDKSRFNAILLNVPMMVATRCVNMVLLITYSSPLFNCIFSVSWMGDKLQ